LSSETWALIGVVVGAVLGAVAQITADRLRRKHDNAMLVRNERREAYAELLAAAANALAPLATARHVFEALGEGRKVQSAENLVASGEALNRLGVAVARVQLAAPDDTHAAALGVQATTLAFMFRDEQGMAEGLAESQAHFARLAKRDLSL